jgi:lycopene cyclase domain-containing protein
MTYFGFLAIFLGIPLVVLAALTILDRRQGRCLPEDLRLIPGWAAILAHVLIAVLYTTPWDNYLVATGVWYYNPTLVTGVTLGWVPIEEYTFFVVQTLLTGLWLLFLARRVRGTDSGNGKWKPFPLHIRLGSAAVLGVVWLGSLGLLSSGWEPGTYLGIILAWALPPIMVQLAFGADMLWRRYKLVGLALLSSTLYLALADSLAIGSGTWTIDPHQSLNIFFGSLPLEELLFFLVTNTLIVFGMTLLMANETRQRAGNLWKAIRFRQPHIDTDRSFK